MTRMKTPSNNGQTPDAEAGPSSLFEARKTREAHEALRIQAANSAFFGALTTLAEIEVLLGHAKFGKIKALLESKRKQLEKYLKRAEAASDQNFTPKQRPASPGGDEIPIEAHPDLPDQGGMPLVIDDLDISWMEELGINPNAVLDKAELQNQLKKALKAKLENALKMVQAPKPGGKQAPAPQVKLYEKLILDVKNKPFLEPARPEYRPAPKWTPPTPHPGA